MNNEISSSSSNNEQSTESNNNNQNELDEYLDGLLRQSNPHLFQTPDLCKIVFESDAQLDSTCELVYNELIDDVLFGLMLQVHRASKLGYLFLFNPESDPEDDKQYEIYDDNDVLGVFSNLNENHKPTGASGRNGQNSIKDQLSKYECSCPNCGRNLAAIRFAPHLEKCMGMGRSSSRIATRRIANYNGDELDQLIEATGLIPNRNYSEPTITSSSSSTNITNDEDIISIINAVATSETANSTTIDIDMSSGSSSSCSFTNNGLKPPNAKKKRLQNSKSGASLTSMVSLAATPTAQDNNVNNLIQAQAQKANFY